MHITSTFVDSMLSASASPHDTLADISAGVSFFALTPAKTGRLGPPLALRAGARASIKARKKMTFNSNSLKELFRLKRNQKLYTNTRNTRRKDKYSHTIQHYMRGCLGLKNLKMNFLFWWP